VTSNENVIFLKVGAWLLKLTLLKNVETDYLEIFAKC